MLFSPYNNEVNELVPSMTKEKDSEAPKLESFKEIFERLLSEYEEPTPEQLKDMISQVLYCCMVFHALCLAEQVVVLAFTCVAVIRSLKCSKNALSREELYMCHNGRSWQYEGGSIVLSYTIFVTWLLGFCSKAHSMGCPPLAACIFTAGLALFLLAILIMGISIMVTYLNAFV